MSAISAYPLFQLYQNQLTDTDPLPVTEKFIGKKIISVQVTVDRNLEQFSAIYFLLCTP
jgi:hypothetical protein